MEQTIGPVLPPASTLRHFDVLAKPTGAICNLGTELPAELRAEEKARTAAFTASPRNDLCPCGSGQTRLPGAGLTALPTTVTGNESRQQV